MTNFFRWFAALCLLASLAPRTEAFSLLGQKTPWHILRLGHPDGQIGGPMNIHEEHRWNIPVIYYGFSPEFLSYFGSRGEEEIEEAIAILRDLPTMSTLNIDDYPLNVTRVNYRAQALGLLDLKSLTLGILIEEMGLGDPTTYVFTLRKRIVTSAPATNYMVIKRNFDPVTKHPSSYINGELYTYTTITEGDTASIAVATAVDPLARNFPVAALRLGAGAFYTGLTRDDVAGLKHIYSRQNANLENAATNSSTTSGVLGGVIAGADGPWGALNFGTNALGGGGIVDTNLTATNLFVNTAIRPGIDRFQFTRANYDSLIGTFTTTNVPYTDQYLLNGRQGTQRLIRPLGGGGGQPDITFHALDFAGAPTPADFADIFTVGRTDAFSSNAGLDGQVTGVGGAGADSGNNGPGVINPGISIGFTSVGVHIFNGAYPANLSEFSTFSPGFLWGSFDGSTNAPLIYPQGTLIEDIERRVLGGR